MGAHPSITSEIVLSPIQAGGCGNFIAGDSQN
jgi:hypothetical protein